MNQHTGDLSQTERAVSALFGLSFSMIAMRRGSPMWRLVSGVAGAALLARSYAGYCGMKAAMTGETSLRNGLSEQWRRTRTTTGATAVGNGQAGPQTPSASSEAIDQSMRDTFPASDPPASHLPDEPPSNAEAKWETARTTGKV